MPPHPIQQRLGTTVRSLRKARGWSRRRLHEVTGISERFLADVESGRANPSLLRLHQLARAFDIAIGALVGGESRPDEHGARRHISLLGLRGAGKSTVGPLLAAQLGRQFVELDARVEAATGLQLSEMFQVHGETYYRQAELAALEQLLTDQKPGVVAIGGGLVVEPTSFALLRQRTITVWLRADPKDHWQRVLQQGDTRPMADNERAFTDLRRLLTVREPYYRRADLVVETSGRAVPDIVDELVQRLRDASGDTNGAGD